MAQRVSSRQMIHLPCVIGFGETKKPRNNSPRPRPLLAHVTHARIVEQKLLSHSVQKKEVWALARYSGLRSRYEEAPHGVSGASWVPWGGTSDGEGAPSHYLLTAFSGSLCQAFCLIEGKKSRREVKQTRRGPSGPHTSYAKHSIVPILLL